jgi:tRNA wybutosine-synthesizing protein 3
MKALMAKIEEGIVDEQIIDVLNMINSSPDYYTSSSCAGRLQLISLPKFGDKVNSVILGKWHEPIELETLKEALGTWDDNNFVMLLVQSPVVHVVCTDLEAALRLRNLADGSGFKYSTIRSIHTSQSDEGVRMNITVARLRTPCP